jgi:hypothetical protein
MALTNVDLYRIDGNTGSVSNIQTAALNGGALAGARNRIINGDMRIDQRNSGASVTVNGTGSYFGTDRFFATGQATDGVFTVARSTTAPAGYTNSLLATVTTADASIGASQIYVLGQRIEGLNIADLGWGATGAATVTLSFWVRSSLTGTFGGSITNETGYSYPFSYTINSANTFEQKSITIAGPTAGTWLATSGTGISVIFSLGSGSTYSGTANAWSANLYYGATGQTQVISTNGATFYITGVQLEPGSVATPFERRSYGQELALCQRYYFKDADNSVNIFQCKTDNATTYNSTIRFPVTMRATPTCTATSGGESLFTSARTVVSQSVDAVRISATTGASAGTGYYQTGITASIEL